MGTRLMKHQHLMEEMESVIVDRAERAKVLEVSLGEILSSTQVKGNLSFRLDCQLISSLPKAPQQAIVMIKKQIRHC